MPAIAQKAEDAPEKVVRIKVVTEENGDRNEINEEREINSEADVDAILEDLGIEIGDLEKGERVEISIRKSTDGGEEDIDIDISSLEEGGLMKSKAFLGVMLRSPDAAELEVNGVEAGAFITEIIEGTQAEKTDLRPGDIITAIDGQPVDSYDTAVQLISNKNAGDELDITYVRGGQTANTTATLGERKQRGKVIWIDEFDGPQHFEFDDEDFSGHQGIRIHHSNANKAFLGVTPACGENENGVTVNIVDNTAASEMGLQDGDVIRSINGTATPNFDALSEALSQYNPGDEVAIEYDRAGATQTTNGALKERPAPKVERFEFNFNGDDFQWNGETPRGNEMAEMEKRPFFGVMPADGEATDKGVRIEVVGNSSAEKMGLQDGDVILSLNGNKTNSWEGISEAIGGEEPGTEMKVVYLRDGKRQTAKGELGSKADRCRSKCNAPCDMSFMLNGETMEIQIEEALEEAFRSLEESGQLSPEELQEIRQEFDDASRQIERDIRIFISVDEVSTEEAEDFNKSTNETLPLENNLTAEEVSVFPNPSMGVINLSFNLPERGNTTVQVFDKTGQTLFLESLSEFQGAYNNQIDLADFAQGTYFVKVTQNGKSFTKKIIKQ